MLRSIDKKMLRDLWRMKSQAFAIVLVIVGGVATLVMSLSTLDSLRLTRQKFYTDYRFADVFVSLKRAPESVRGRMAEIPGVERVETRVVAGVRLEVQGFADPVTGMLVSLPENNEPVHNSLFLSSGRYAEPGKDREAVISEAFAEAHGLLPGDGINAIINGKRETLNIVGIALSPEFVYQLKPGAMIPDFKRYAIIWMGRKPLAAAYDMEGAFNNAVLSLMPGASEEDVIERIDNLLEPYGGLGAYGRKDQISHRYLSEEFRQLAQMATMFPTIFLGVAAFLLNVVIGRVVNMQREQAAALKALGYGNLDIGMHYIKLVVIITLVGVAGGLGAGTWLGSGLSNIYIDFYRLPFLSYWLRPNVIAIAVSVSLAAAIAGTVFSVRRAAVMPPAQAMRPEPPAEYRKTLVERLGVGRFLSQPARMIARHIGRRPVKSTLTVTGIAMACAILVFGSFFDDAVNFMIDVQFGRAQREDLSVTFTEPTSKKALFELRSIPGVEHVEPYRAVPVKMKFEQRSYRTYIMGVEKGSTLYRLLDVNLDPIEVPPGGMMLTDYLGEILGVKSGDMVAIEVLEGSRPKRQVQVVAMAKQFLGVSGFMEIGALNRLMREGPAISGAYIAVDRPYMGKVYDALNGMPRVVSAESTLDVISNFRETMSRQLLIYSFFISILAGVIAFGVVYNSARITLSERGRELASLRVLGLTRGEISYILLGELALLTLVAIPFGFLIGKGLAAYMLIHLQTDLYRIPMVMDKSTYAFAATIVLISAAFSGLVVRRKLDRLDLIAVLKTKE